MTTMNGNDERKAIEERRRYVEAFNGTMLRIWEEQIDLLGVYRTGALLRSLTALETRADGRFAEVSLSQQFLAYGVYVDAGVGREVYRGNPGDIGRDKKRKAKRWFSRKYYASVMNLKDFFARSLGREFLGIISDSLDDRALSNRLQNKN